MLATRYSLLATFAHVSLSDPREILKLESAIGEPPIAVFGLIVNIRVRTGAAIIRLVVDFEAGEWFYENQFALAAHMELEIALDELPRFSAQQSETSGAA